MLVGGQDLPDELHVVRLLHADEDDREVARDAEPQRPSCPSVFFARVSPSARSEASEKKTREAEPLEELGLFDGDAKMPQ